MQFKKKRDFERKNNWKVVFPLFLIYILLAFMFAFAEAAPNGPANVNITANETAGATGAATVNISGGYIATLNITAASQNPRWKAFVGQVSGSFSLQDASGSTLYDWSLTSVSGEIYATRNASSVTWANSQCANTTLIETENLRMNHSSSADNITATFDDTTHSAFVVAGVSITANTCPTLNTYVGNATQDTDFEEMIITDSTNFTAGGNLIYVTIMESNAVGFDSVAYDFQMIVPENGLDTFTSSTAYYLYVELT